MNLYQKLPIIVEARKLDSTNNGLREIIDWVNAGDGAARQKPGFDAVDIDTLEGTMTAGPGDWVVQGAKGEFYPVKPEAFDVTFEPATTDAFLDAPSLVALKRFKPVGITRTGHQEAAEKLRRKFHDIALELLATIPPTKSRAVALTELETSMMWALRAFYGAPNEAGAGEQP